MSHGNEHNGVNLFDLHSIKVQESLKVHEDTSRSSESSSFGSRRGNFGTKNVLKASPIDPVCSMCGDVGIPEDLFRCHRCDYRYQHIYCSRAYPNLGSEIWICNWCLHEGDKTQGDNRKTGDSGFVSQIAHFLPQRCSDTEKVLDAKEFEITSDIPVRKRQRYGHAAEKSRGVGMDKWQQIAKNRLQMQSSKGIIRRYKLLADVL